MIIRAQIKELREDGTAVIEVPVDIGQVLHKQVKECFVELIDSRRLSDKQRRMCYALINAIAEWSGSTTEDVKQAFKMEFWADKVDTLAEKIFSLSDAPMSLVAEFQKFLIRFILENDVPLKFSLLDYADDINDYVYQCLIHKKCAVCGRRAELHHLEGSVVGMGNDRTDIDHLGKEAISLCRNHHTECHTIGQKSFFEKYHLNGGVKIDKTICKIYNLKYKKEN